MNENNPVISSERISSTGGVRDPNILRGSEGKTIFNGSNRHGICIGLELEQGNGFIEVN